MLQCKILISNAHQNKTLMNNGKYIVQKVNDSELGVLAAQDWAACLTGGFQTGKAGRAFSSTVHSKLLAC